MSDAPRSQHALTLPDDYNPVVWEKFDTLNTKSPRPAIGDGECSWFDGFMPIGESNARALWGVGGFKFTASSGQTVLWLGFGNVGDTAYGIVLQSDGSIYQFDIATGALVQIMSAGTILAPSSVLGFSQWGSQYLIFAKDQMNGYWLWDGSNLFTAGTMGPEVTLTNAGSGYSSAPSVTLQTTGGGTATFAAQIINDTVSLITVTNPGTGFAIGDFSALNIRGGGSDDQAQAGVIAPTLSSGGVSQVIIANGGSKYTARAFIEFIGGGGSGAVASLSLQNGVVTAVAIVNAGSGYTSPPIVGVNDPGIPGSGGSAIPGGTGFSGYCNIAFGQITGISIAYGGSGYDSPPTLKILGDGTNAAGIVTVDGNQVTGVVMSNFGSGYTKALAVFEGGNRAANADPLAMPFGVSGTAIEVFSARVWVTNGGATAAFPPKNRTIFSGPNSPVDFSNGGGAFQSTDSFLRVGYHWMRQTNGFMYLGGDSSINYVTGVQTTTTGTTAVTTFNVSNVNVDPQYGSPWPGSVQVFGRNIVFANTIGVFISYGGAVTKASLPLDGFYGTGPIYALTANFSSAVAQVFGIPVYMLLLPVVDQFSGELVNKLLMYDGKRWFTSQQDRTLTFIATQEINSVLTAWGTDGTNVFPLFAKPSEGFLKVIQSKLFSTQSGYWTNKTALRLTGVVRLYASVPALTVTIDNEGGIGTDNALASISPASPVEIVNASGVDVSVVNASNQPVTVVSLGIVVFGPLPVGQQGRMLGMTLQTLASDMALLSLNLAGQTYTVDL